MPPAAGTINFVQCNWNTNASKQECGMAMKGERASCQDSFCPTTTTMPLAASAKNHSPHPIIMLLLLLLPTVPLPLLLLLKPVPRMNWRGRLQIESPSARHRANKIHVTSLTKSNVVKSFGLTNMKLKSTKFNKKN